VRAHLAIVERMYVDLIASGVKTIEARLSVQRRAPWGRVGVGDVVFFKPRSGPVALEARVSLVRQYQALTPTKIAQLREAFGDAIAASDAFWDEKRRAVYATLVGLAEVRPVESPPALPPAGHRRNAWCVLSGCVAPAARVVRADPSPRPSPPRGEGAKAASISASR